jgi:hypothetical protein
MLYPNNSVSFKITAVRNSNATRLRLKNILGSEVTKSSTQIPTFYRNVLLPYLGWKMGAASSFKMLVPSYQTIWHYISENHYLNIHHCENLNIKLPVITITQMFITMSTKMFL